MTEEPIKGYQDGTCPTCGDRVSWTVLLWPGRTVRMGECRQGHWNQTEELADRGV